MKNFIFAMCGFLMMSLVSLSVQASSVESPKREYVNPSVDVGLPDIQFITLETAPADCVVLTMREPHNARIRLRYQLVRPWPESRIHVRSCRP